MEEPAEQPADEGPTEEAPKPEPTPEKKPSKPADEPAQAPAEKAAGPDRGSDQAAVAEASARMADEAAAVEDVGSVAARLDLRRAPDLVAATADVGAFVDLSASLKRAALHTSKVCHDLRLLSSGPRSGIGDIVLPAVQAGSSIMPGKVNPVLPEVVRSARGRLGVTDL